MNIVLNLYAIFILDVGLPLLSLFDFLCCFILGLSSIEDLLLGAPSYYNSGAHNFVIPVIAFPDEDDDIDNNATEFPPNYHGTRICVIPPTPLPEGYDPYDI